MKQYKGIAFARVDDPKVRDQLATIDEFLLDLQTGVARLSNGNSASASGGVIVAPPDLSPYLFLPGVVGGQTLKTVGWTSGAVPVFSITAANDVTAVLALTATNTTGQLVLTNTALTMNTGALGYLDIHDSLVASSTYGPYLSVHGDAAPPVGDMILITSWFGNAAYGSASVPFEVRGRFFGHVGLCRVVGNAVPNFDFYGTPTNGVGHAVFTQNNNASPLLDMTSAAGNTVDYVRFINSSAATLARITKDGYVSTRQVLMNGSTSGTLTHIPAAVTTNHSLTWPSANATGALTNDGAGALSWATAGGGGVGMLTYTAQTGTYSILTTDGIVDCDGTFTITLPTAVGVAGQYYELKNSGTGVITVDTTSAQTIDGGATAVLTTQYESITVASTGTNWIII